LTFNHCPGMKLTSNCQSFIASLQVFPRALPFAALSSWDTR